MFLLIGIVVFFFGFRSVYFCLLGGVRVSGWEIFLEKYDILDRIFWSGSRF